MVDFPASYVSFSRGVGTNIHSLLTGFLYFTSLPLAAEHKQGSFIFGGSNLDDKLEHGRA